ncbi:hypothetical protein D3C78_1251640 [compost metagenome]
MRRVVCFNLVSQRVTFVVAAQGAFIFFGQTGEAPGQRADNGQHNHNQPQRAQHFDGGTVGWLHRAVAVSSVIARDDRQRQREKAADKRHQVQEPQPA